MPGRRCALCKSNIWSFVQQICRNDAKALEENRIWMVWLSSAFVFPLPVL